MFQISSSHDKEGLKPLFFAVFFLSFSSLLPLTEICLKLEIYDAPSLLIKLSIPSLDEGFTLKVSCTMRPIKLLSRKTRNIVL